MKEFARESVQIERAGTGDCDFGAGTVRIHFPLLRGRALRNQVALLTWTGLTRTDVQES